MQYDVDYIISGDAYYIPSRHYNRHIGDIILLYTRRPSNVYNTTIQYYVKNIVVILSCICEKNDRRFSGVCSMLPISHYYNDI